MLKGGESVAEEMHKLDDLTRIITDSMNEMSAVDVVFSPGTLRLSLLRNLISDAPFYSNVWHRR